MRKMYKTSLEAFSLCAESVWTSSTTKNCLVAIYFFPSFFCLFTNCIPFNHWPKQTAQPFISALFNEQMAIAAYSFPQSEPQRKNTFALRMLMAAMKYAEDNMVLKKYLTLFYFILQLCSVNLLLQFRSIMLFGVSEFVERSFTLLQFFRLLLQILFPQQYFLNARKDFSLLRHQLQTRDR